MFQFKKISFQCTVHWVNFKSNRIAKPFNKTLNRWKIMMLHGFQIYFAWNPRLKSVESTIWAVQPIRLDSTQTRPNLILCLAGKFYTLQPRISCNTYRFGTIELEPLKHALSPSWLLVPRVCNHIRNHLNALWPGSMTLYSEYPQIFHTITADLLKHYFNVLVQIIHS